ncbi:MAG: transglycosylase SLT domain-containing protein [Paludibacteraceae bacterium]|nr:transglycosylase SLT domain-containing protein [Paludibacteraceae bacterium]
MMFKRQVIWGLLGLLLLLAGCVRKSVPTDEVRDLAQIVESGVLRVVTMSGPMSYFSYKDNDMGYEYEFAKHLAEELGVEMQLLVVDNTEEMVASLLTGKADLIAYRLPCTTQNKDRVLFTKREYITNQVIVQCKSDTMVRNILDLNGKEVHVIKNSIYENRLRNINEEIGGDMIIVEADDSLTLDDLISQVAHKQIGITIADMDLARLDKTYFSNIDYSLEVSFPQRSAWAVSKEAVDLLYYINEWTANTQRKLYFSAIYRKYFEKSKYFESVGMVRINGRSRISSFDDIFRKYASIPGWDWRLLSAVAYKESKFDPNVISWAGACGLMQLMPSTAVSLGMTEEEFHNPDLNVKAGAMYIRKLERLFAGVEDREERIKFTLAAYNSGPGHIFDARALAEKHGKNPDVWSEVEPYVLLKADPEYYTDEVCKYGYCRGEETVDYVRIIWDKYEEYKTWAHK